MRARRRAATGARVALVLIVVCAAVAVAGSASAVAVAGFAPSADGSIPATDSTVTRIAVAANGTATWEVQVRTRLTTDADVADYERFQERFRENTSEYLDSFRRSMRGVVADAATETGRRMRARNFRASTSVQAAPRQWGIVTYEFEWTNFASRDGDAVVVGDVFRGQFLLTRNDSLAVTAPSGYVVAGVEPDPDGESDERVRWTGRRTFAEDRPFVRFEPRATPTPTPATPDGTATPRDAPTPTAGPGQSDDGPGTTVAGSAATSSRGVPLLALAVVSLVLVALAAYRYRNRSTGAGTTSGVTPENDAVAAGAGAGGGEATDVAGEPGAAGTDDVESDIGPTPPLTDAERVRELLAEHDGQLYQGDIVEALDWSKSKGSRVLSDMAEDGEVEKLRIGRRNVIRLAEDEGDGEF